MNDNFGQAMNHITGNDPVQPALLYGFSVLSRQNLAKFQAIWPQIEAERREEIMQMLVEIAEHSFEVDFEPIFILGLNDPAPEVQVNAIEGLWESESVALIPPLIHLLKTGQTIAVRQAAAQALGQYIYLGEIEEIDQTAFMVTQQALLQTIRNAQEDLDIVRRAIESISFSGDKGIAQIIENAYYHDDEKMQISAVFAMGRNGDAKKWKSLVLTELDNHNPKIRFEAVRAAGELQLSEAASKLIHLVQTEVDSEIQQSAIWSLGQIGGEVARETLEELLDSDDEALQTAAEEALDELILWSSKDIEEFFSYTISTGEDDMHIVDFNGGETNNH